MGKLINEFAEELQKKIQNNETIKTTWDIQVFEENGVVTLDGTVRSKKASEEVESFILEQEGVKGVVNELDIDPEMAEEEIKEVIESNPPVPPTSHPHQ